MGYQLPVEATVVPLATTPGCNCCRIRIASGLTVFEAGVVGGVLKIWPKPNPSHSFVTPTQLPALFRYSTRIHGPVIAEGVEGLLVSSSISGHVVHVVRPLSV